MCTKVAKLVISLKIPTWRKLSQFIQREISMISNENDNILKSGRSGTSFKIVNTYKRS